MRYSEQLDHIILAVHYALRGKKRKAAKSLQKVLDDNPMETERVLASLSKLQDKSLGSKRHASRFVGETVDHEELAFDRRPKRKRNRYGNLKRRARTNIRYL